MAELEKVIRGLECCLNTGNFEECTENCPYFTKKLGMGVCSENMQRDALSLLKAQEPRVKPIKELEDTDEPVFIELRTKEEGEEKLTCFGLLEHWDNLAFHFIVDQWLLDGKPFFRIYGCELKRKEYNIQWRPWNKRPTIEQMKAVKWE